MTWDQPDSDPVADVQAAINRIAGATPTRNRTAVLLLTHHDHDRYRAEFGDELESIVDEMAQRLGFADGKIELLAEHGPHGQRGFGFDGV